MRLVRDSDNTLRQFILGELQERPRLEIEERLITDPDLFEALGIAEEELAEEYLEDGLSAADKQRFERHYLTSRDHRRHLNFIRLLKSYAASARRRVHAHESSDWRRIGDLVRFHPAWAAAAAAVLVLLMGGNLWFVTWNLRLQGQFDQVRAQQEQMRQKLEGQVAELRTQSNSQPNGRGRESGPGQSPTFTLRAGRLRGPGSPVVGIVVPAGVQHIRLQLQLPADDSSPYRAALLDGAGDGIWSQSRLKAESTGGRGIVNVSLPAELLSPGDYLIKLSSTSAHGDLEVIATYTFRVNVP